MLAVQVVVMNKQKVAVMNQHKVAVITIKNVEIKNKKRSSIKNGNGRTRNYQRCQQQTADDTLETPKRKINEALILNKQKKNETQ